MERMGFEKNKRFVKVMNNERVTATVGGKKCYFRSLFEYRWSQYLEILKQSGQIKDWFYEPCKFTFPGETTSPVMYRIDFLVQENDGTDIFQELKGYHDGSTNKKLQRMAKHHPQVILELVLQSIPKQTSKGANRRHTASKYVRRIVNGTEILHQVKGVIQWNPPIVNEL